MISLAASVQNARAAVGKMIGGEAKGAPEIPSDEAHSRTSSSDTLTKVRKKKLFRIDHPGT
ncbi:MAG: hypothetical protein WBD10_00295 [Acidobacteriaceae bacterium]